MMFAIFSFYLMGIVSFIFNRYHFMMILMSLEFMYMSLMFIFLMNSLNSTIMNMFVFLVTIVCEASLGLALLVMMSFFYGNELINSMNLVKC
uniref:NADH dehydrogenase subunit 4L n=1 Tax=Amblyomma papuanum TaxID=3065601 RepID=UPI0030FE9BD5